MATHAQALRDARENHRFNPGRKVYIYAINKGRGWRWHYTYDAKWMAHRRVNKTS